MNAQQETDRQSTITAIADVLENRAAYNRRAAMSLATAIYDNEPQRCDFDCDHCRDE
jgi:hypothetical protein